MTIFIAGYSHLTSTLLEELTRPDAEINMDKSHFLWLLTYFLKFASQLEIGLDQIRQVLSVNTLAYLTYQGKQLIYLVSGCFIARLEFLINILLGFCILLVFLLGGEDCFLEKSHYVRTL